MPAYRPSNRYNRKNYFTSKPKANRGKQYRKYYHQQPSKVVYVEEPDSEIESESESEVTDYSEEVEDSDIESEVYEFDLNENEQPELEYYESSDYDTDDYNDIIDLNDELENAAVDRLDSRGKVYDLNDELVRYYDDSDSDSDSSSDSDSELDSELEAELELYEPEDILDIIDLNDQLQAEALKQITGGEYDEANSSSDISSSESDSDDDSDIDSDDSDSETDLDIEYSSDEEDLNDQLQLENVRQVFADDLVSEDEVSVPSESDLESETEYIEVESDMDSGSEDEQEYDICDECNAFDDESSDSSDDEGITIYRHRFDLPDSYGSDYEVESDYSDEEIPEQLMLRANDSDDEIAMIDLSEDLQNSKDCELVDLNDHTYKLNLRFPSIVKDELKIDFIKNKNELVISGRFNFDADSDDEEIEEEIEEQAQEIEDEQEENKEADNAENSSSSSSSSDSSSSTSSSSSDSDSDSDSDSESSSSSESDDSDSGSDSESELSSSDSEEVQEDTESLIQDFANHEIRFEKHFQFDKVIKFNEIKAKFLKNGELELIIPNENQENILSIDVESDDESVTDEIIEDQNQIEGSNANVELGVEKDEQYEDASMEQ